MSATSSPLGQNVHPRTCSHLGWMPAGSCLSKPLSYPTPEQAQRSQGWPPLSWLVSHSLWGFLRDEAPSPCSGTGDGGFNPHWSGQAGQGGQAATLPPERKHSSRTCTKIFPSPIPAFPPSRGNSDLTFAGCCRTPDSKAELGYPKMRGSLPVLPGASLLWKRDLAKGLWRREVPPGHGRSRALQALHGGDPTTPILYLQHQGDSRALWVGLGHPEGATPRNSVGSFLGRSRRPRLGS